MSPELIPLVVAASYGVVGLAPTPIPVRVDEVPVVEEPGLVDTPGVEPVMAALVVAGEIPDVGVVAPVLPV